MENKPNIILYLSYWDSIKNLDLKQKGQLLDLLYLFQLGEELPEADPLVDMAFSFIKADIMRNNDRYDDIVEKRKEAGRKGGIASGKTRASKQNEANEANEANPSKRSKVKEKEIEKENIKKNIKENETVCSDTQSRTREDDTDDTYDTHTETEPTRIPTHAAIREENANKGYGLSAESIEGFVEYNRDRGWKMNWRDALAKWAAREKERKKKHPAGSFANFPGRQGEEKEKNDDMAKQIIAMQTGGEG